MKKWYFIPLTLALVLGLVTSLILHRDKRVTFPESDPNHTAHYPLTFVAHLKNDPNAGKKIFFEYCASCHDEKPLIPVHAPRIGHQKEWKGFLALGMKQLTKLALEGNGAMPARGGCFECSDQQIKQAILYIIKNSKE